MVAVVTAMSVTRMGGIGAGVRAGGGVIEGSFTKPGATPQSWDTSLSCSLTDGSFWASSHCIVSTAPLISQPLIDEEICTTWAELLRPAIVIPGTPRVHHN
jgi:hypothetical protein